MRPATDAIHVPGTFGSAWHVPENHLCLTPNPQSKTSHPYWAQRVDRLKAPDAPPEALNLNVAGRRAVGPLQGFGQLWQKTFCIRLVGASVTPAEVIAEWKAELPRFKPAESRFYPSPGGIARGEEVLINAWTPGGPIATGVVVLYADDESFTLMTPEGHPESGWVTMSAYVEDGVTVAQVQGLARASDPIYELAFRAMGSRLQDTIWEHVLTELAAHFGVKGQPVEVDRWLLDPKVQWRRAGNIWHNAQIRTILYQLAAPIRWVRRVLRRD